MNNSSLAGMLFISFLFVVAATGCAEEKKHIPADLPVETVTVGPADHDTTPAAKDHIIPERRILPAISGNVQPDSIVAFARTLIGVPYLYASTDPAMGFDCSGFITFVFNHFSIAVPRSSVDFTNYGKELSLSEAKPGDLILFTGTDSTVRIVGHMGIVENVKDGQLHFIHSTSGKAKGVVITPFEKYYQSRFVKVIRILPDELFR